jgi:hypothetical protein
MIGLGRIGRCIGEFSLVVVDGEDDDGVVELTVVVIVEVDV